ncbi:MAG: YfiR family protein [Acidobacteria bacterium]|nr:YfiR family protein [Acidobacteriota bacterium]
MKAAFLLNFTKFVEWPSTAFADAGTPIRICVVGEDPFGTILDRTLEGENVKGRRIEAVRFRRGGRMRNCQILFVSRSERERTAQILSQARGSSVVTVSELARFSDRGGMIEFRIEEGKVRFYINGRAAEAAGVKLSSRLLRAAKAVKDSPR